MPLNILRDRITNKIIMPDGMFTLCIVNCTHKDLYMMDVRGDRIQKLKPIEDIVDGEKVDLKWTDKLAYGWLISKHFLNGLPQRCDGTVKVFAIHQTYVKSSLEGERVVRDFQLLASYNPEKPAWKDANYIPIVEMNAVVSFDYDFLEQMLLQFESSAEGVLAMIEGKLTQYDGLVTMLINCSENDYYTVVDNNVIPVPNMRSFDWFTHGENSEFGLNEEYREEAMHKWKSSVMKEFGLSKNQILEGHDMFVSITASHDYPRRKMNLKNLPKDKTYQKFVYQIQRLLKEENVDEYLKPFFVEGTNTPVFRSKEAAELFIKVFHGKVSLYHGAQHAIRIKRMADYKLGLVRQEYIKKETSVIKTAKRFVISSFMDKSFDLICNYAMKFIDFLLGKGSKAAKKASEAAMAGKDFYKMSSMFTAGLMGAGGRWTSPFDIDNRGPMFGNRGMAHRTQKVYPNGQSVKDKLNFSTLPSDFYDKEQLEMMRKEREEQFDKELKKAVEKDPNQQYLGNVDIDNLYYDLNGIPIKGGIVTLMDYKTVMSNRDIQEFRDKRKNNQLFFIPKSEMINGGPNDFAFEVDYDKLEECERKVRNGEVTVKMIDFNKVCQLNYQMWHLSNQYMQQVGLKDKSEANNVMAREIVMMFKTKFAQLRDKRDRIIAEAYPEYIRLREHVRSDIATKDGFASGYDKDIGPGLQFHMEIPERITEKEFAQSIPSYTETVIEQIEQDKGGDDRWQTDRLEVEETYEEVQVSKKHAGEKGKGFFRRVFDKVKSIWCSKPAKIVRRVVGLGLIVVGIWKAINKWKDLAEALIF